MIMAVMSPKASPSLPLILELEIDFLTCLGAVNLLLLNSPCFHRFFSRACHALGLFCLTFNLMSKATRMISVYVPSSAYYFYPKTFVIRQCSQSGPSLPFRCDAALTFQIFYRPPYPFSWPPRWTSVAVVSTSRLCMRTSLFAATVTSVFSAYQIRKGVPFRSRKPE